MIAAAILVLSSHVPVRAGLDGLLQSAVNMELIQCAAPFGVHGRKKAADGTSCVRPLLYASFSNVEKRVRSFFSASFSFVLIDMYSMCSAAFAPPAVYFGFKACSPLQYRLRFRALRFAYAYRLGDGHVFGLSLDLVPRFSFRRSGRREGHCGVDHLADPGVEGWIVVYALVDVL